MAKKEYFLYGGLFLAGAILTPAAVGLFGQGDRPAETTETAANETFGNGDSEPSFMADEPTTATFAENDSREQILKDYETVSPEALRNIPTAIPQYATNQPSVPPYPNYWANIRIPNFASQPLNPNPSAGQPSGQTAGDRPPNNVASVPTLDSQTPPDAFQPDPATSAQENPNFQGQDTIQAPSSVNLRDFVNSAPARELTPP
ncbi:hypothetical protein [Picosynechococcus sp. PCC 8807]|uniref:hypothetical protein n=1 Tax=Picosynechococcus sp. PCC 8807 TaxID=195248 RepID=UPI0008107F0B|nr:hypothetical protein [Picosynechococcus sp. PCC 8807]ANV90236.1 hypothetical protein AWQ24_06140 [Picosynechococcus sp. PCC 8807]